MRREAAAAMAPLDPETSAARSGHLTLGEQGLLKADTVEKLVTHIQTPAAFPVPLVASASETGCPARDVSRERESTAPPKEVSRTREIGGYS